MSEEMIIDAMAECVLPEDIMLCILARLPVKSLLRFKSVCKPWCELFATPKFIKMHTDQFSSYPQNQAFIISDVDNAFMSLLSIDSDMNKPASLDIPYHDCPREMSSVGCCGLVCFGLLFGPYDMEIALWNPALRLSKFVSVPDFCVIQKISLGFGYDAEGDDFKVVKIVEQNTGVVVEVYSAKSDTWERIELAFQFRLLGNRNESNDAIVNGNPYWVAMVDENESHASYHGEDLVWCDVTRLEFKMVPLSGLRVEEVADVPFVDWKGSLAALLSTKNDERLESLDVWVFHNGEMAWRKIHTFGPIEMKVDRCLQCSKNGIIMGDCQDGKLFVFDPETRRVKEIEIGEFRKESLEIYGYSESLAYIEGMQQILVEEEEDEVEEEGDE